MLWLSVAQDSQKQRQRVSSKWSRWAGCSCCHYATHSLRSFYLDLMMVWNMGRTTVFEIFHSTARVQVDQLKYQGFPIVDDACSKLANKFACSRQTMNPLYRCVGALDGIAVQIHKPCRSECSETSSYYHHKGYSSIPVQAICDSLCQFVFVWAKCDGPVV